MVRVLGLWIFEDLTHENIYCSIHFIQILRGYGSPQSCVSVQFWECDELGQHTPKTVMPHSQRSLLFLIWVPSLHRFLEAV